MVLEKGVLDRIPGIIKKEMMSDDTIGEVEEALDVKSYNFKYYVINF